MNDGVTTEAGRALAGRRSVFENLRDAVLAIEAEAVEDERRRLYEAVVKMYHSRHVLGYSDPRRWVRKSDVLALLAPPAENPGCPECGLVGAHNERCASQWSASTEKEQT